MNSNREKRIVAGKFGDFNKGLYWSIGGMVGGLVVGLAIANIYGWTLLSATFWIGFGLIVGAVSGAVSYMLYRVISGLVLGKRGEMRLG